MNEKQRAWFRIRDAADKPRTAEVDILDEIGAWYGVTAQDFARQLAALDVDQINLRINSPGGDVFDGIAIMNALRQHPATVQANVIGLAASAASFIAVGGADKVVMSENSMMMIHDASGVVIGNAVDMAEMSGLLDKISDNIASIYAGKAGGSTREWRDVMRAERWYTAADAVDAGLADAADGPAADGQPVDELLARVSASAIRQQGHTITDVREAAAALGRVPAPEDLPAVPGLENTTQRKESPVDPITEGVYKRLGMKAESDAAEVLAALDARLAEPNLPAGVVAVDKTVLDAMQADVAAGRAALDELRTNRLDAVLTDALQAGKITAASKAAWRAALDTNEDATVALLNTMAANTVPVEPIGYTGGVDEAPDDETALYNRIYAKEA